MNFASSANVFSDEIFSATDLNRRGGYVLDRATENPVTITRNEQSFALLRRDDISKLTREAQYTRVFGEIIDVAFRLSIGRDVSIQSQYSWLQDFDADELKEFITELLDAYHSGIDTENWQMLEATIYEWQESAIAINSNELADAFAADTEEISLTNPNLEIVES